MAKVDITPQYPIRLSGFAFRQKESEGIHQPIYARALAIRSKDRLVVLVSVDSIGLPASLRDEIAERLETKCGLAPQDLALCATHSHSAPALSGVLPTMFGAPVPDEHQERIDRYTQVLSDRIEEVALAAIDDLQLSTVSFGIGKVEFAINRRTRGGPVDHDLPILAIRSSEGKLRGIWLSYACHCVVLSDYKISGDWAGCASAAIERKYPNSIALVSIGCGADANPAARGTVEIAQQFGQEILAEVDRVLGLEMKPVRGEIITTMEAVRLPLAEIRSKDEWQQLADSGGIDGYYAQYQLDQLNRGEELPTEVDYLIQTWKFGDSLASVFLPGEVVVDYSLRLKKEYDRSRIWINAYSNDMPAYIPSERILKEGGYEAGDAMHFYGWPAWFAPELEEKIIATIGRQLGEEFKPHADAADTLGIRPKNPAESLVTIKVPDELQVELVASEPMIRDPVAIDFGPDGKVWIAEMHDYGCKDGAPCAPAGRVVVLEDRDSDGSFETSNVFLDQIASPMGVSVWREGVLISAAPDVLYAEDTDDDGKADTVEILISGFGTDHPQARVNGFAYGLDGWLYAACTFGGRLENRKLNKVSEHLDSDFRFKPDTGAFELETGRTQQSRVRDDWGNWFGCNNSVLCWHYPLSERYLRRNSKVLPPTLSVSVASPEAAQLRPRGELVLWELSGPPGKATAACGIGVYRDTALGASYFGNVFTCEPVNQLVHRMELRPSGATFVGVRPADAGNTEFLTSTDNWFRPVQARTGPDGALWIVDMYRFVIEHSRWIPQESLDEVDVMAGASMGRIYRVVRRDAKPRPFPRLDLLDTAQLADAMDSANGWQRDMVQQMLVWRGDQSAVEPLSKLAAHSHNPATKLQALCTLEQLSALTDEILEKTMNDPHAQVRRHAVRIAERRLNDSPQLLQAALRLADDSNPFVALQLACSLGEVADSALVLDALTTIADTHADDPYVVAAVLSSIRESDAPRVVAMAMSQPVSQLPLPFVGRLVEFAATVAEPGELSAMLEFAERVITESGHERRYVLLNGLLTGMGRNSHRKQFQSGEYAFRTSTLAGMAMEAAENASAPFATRLDCIEALGHLPTLSDEQVAGLAGLVSPRHPLELQLAAIESLSLQNDARIMEQLLPRWQSTTPALRTRLLDMMMSRTEWLIQLLEAIRDGDVPAADLGASHRYRVARNRDERVQALAAACLEQSVTSERQAVVARFLDSLPAGDRKRGNEVFIRHCAPCHRFKDEGSSVGPDLAGIKDRSPEGLIREILDPNRAVDPRYLEYIAITNDGRVKNGILVEESASSVTVVGQQGDRSRLLRSELESLVSTGTSLMPEGFENQLSRQDLADLIAALQAQ